MAGIAPVDWPNTGGNGYWWKKMTGTVVTRTSDNSTDATETALDACLIPTGVITSSSLIRIWSLWGLSNNSGTGTTKNLALRFDSNPISSPSSGGASLVSTSQTTNVAGTLVQEIWFGNSLASQYMLNGNASVGGTFNTNAILNRTVDFSVDRNITFCAAWALNQAVSQTITLNGWLVEVFR